MKIKRTFFLFLLIISSCLLAEEISFSAEFDSIKVTDGPYLFWQGDSLIAEYFYVGQYHRKAVAKSQLETQPFTIEVLNFSQNILPQPQAQNDHFPPVDKFFVLSDIHGQFAKMRQILLAQQIIDEDNNWHWQNGHLIIAGDVFDRGMGVTEALWLIYQLEQQAAVAGGGVHYLLGNHDLLLFQNDIRYVHEKYVNVSHRLEKTYSEIFSAESVLGQWLLTKPVIIGMNDFLFTHGGISPQTAEKFSETKMINALIEAYLQTSEKSENIAFLTGNNGPLWYRGYFQESKYYSLISQKEIDKILQIFAVHKIVVGHTTQDSICTLWQGNIIAVDAGIKYGDRGEGLLWQEDEFYRAKADGSTQKLFKE
ncbi:MAG TPA: metallophosphoesterase [Candidatus Cloacimonadota bacterium]|nr:metallophosphoesterase [Candidatus Cloacimonadota bacterium]